MMTEQRKVVERAKKEIGYLEKKSNKGLDSKTKNAGFNNFTKYNRDLKKVRKAGALNDYWCCSFVCMVFIYALGVERAKAVLCNCFTAYVPTMYDAFEKNKRIVKTPKFGDVVFFHNLSHIGIVVGVTKKYVYTIEGNTSVKGFNANGGGVAKKKYIRGSSWIYAFGRPKYKKVVTKATKKKTLPTLKKGSKGKAVKTVQKLLKIKTDGIFGTETEKAVKKYQKKKGLQPDGVVGSKTWAKLLK